MLRVPNAYHYKIHLWSLMLLALSLGLSPFFMTLAQIFLVANWICEGRIKEKMEGLWKEKAALAIIGIYLLHLIGLIYTSDFGYALKDLNVKLPILLLPLIVVTGPQLTKKDQDVIWLTFLGGMLLGTAISMYIYFGFTGVRITSANYSSSHIQELSPMISHIRYSLLMCIGAYTAIYFFLKEQQVLKKIGFALLALWLILFLGILGVRSGLLAFFASALVISMYQIIMHRKMLLGAVLLAAIVLTPYLFYKNITMFRLGVDEVKWELGYYEQGGKPSGHSIPQRFAFWKASKDLIAMNPVVGVGTGDMVQAYHDYYQAHPDLLDANSQYRAHNQYLSITVAFGLLGLLLFLGGIFFPFFTTGHQGNVIWMAFFITFIVSMLIEDTIETQAGVTFFGFFVAFFARKKEE